MLPLDGEVDSWQVDNILFLFPIHNWLKLYSDDFHFLF